MTFLETHKHLVIVVVIAVAVLFIVFKVVSHFDGVAHDKRVLAEEQVKEDLQKAQLQAAQSKTDTAALQTQLNTLAASNQALQAGIAQLRSQLASQRQKDSVMPPSDLADRWHMLVPDGQIKLLPDGLEADLPAAHATVSALEEIPVLKTEKERIENNSSLKDETISRALKVRDDKDAELVTCKKTLQDDENKYNEKIKEIRAKDLKRGMWATIGGFISGVIFGARKL